MEPRIITRSHHNISRQNIDPDALKVLYRLYRAGFTAYLVGGSVRDLLLSRKPKDFDIGTSARPPQVRKLFRNCWIIGKRFRLAHIHFQGSKVVEVSTFRSEPLRDETDPDSELLVRQDNTFGTPEEDAMRRDFTINGLFYDIGSFSLIDYVDGMDDIESRTIRTIGDPNIRFREDPLRMIRAIKFAARLDFTIEADTWDALILHRYEILKSPPSRVLEEIARLLEGGAAERSFELLAESGFLSILMPTVMAYLHPDRSLWEGAVGRVEERLRARQEAANDDGADGGEGPLPLPDMVGDRVPWRGDDVLWDILAAADRQWPRSRTSLYAAFVHPMLEACRTVSTVRDVERMSQDLLASGAFGSVITRKERDRIGHILQSYRRMLQKRRKDRPGAILRKPYFVDALQFLEIVTQATGVGQDEARQWRERYNSFRLEEDTRRLLEDDDERLDSREYRFYMGPLDDEDEATGQAVMPSFEGRPEALGGESVALPPAATAGSPVKRRIRAFAPGRRLPWAHLP